jgi:hypothetical protein
MAKLTPELFCYWLQGFMEMQDPKELDCTQTQIIKDHLNEVFDKVTPQRTGLPHFCKSELPEGFEKLEIKPNSKRRKITIKNIVSDGRRSSGSLLVC